uniref:MULE transposase domain-containing protein n=1 Tax=Panagrolaimus superbus TaxID=310955 RepID=A0A914YSW2_9BILA
MEDKGIGILKKAQYWKFDGTFEKRPPGFAQVYTIVAVFCDYPERQKSFFCGTVFVKEKDTVAYERLFQKLKDLVGEDIGPKEFGFDHELAALNGANIIFPDAKIILCFWHYPKNLKDYARSKKCSNHLATDKNFQRWLNQLIGSSFLPLEWMTGVVDYLLDNPPELHELLHFHSSLNTLIPE